MKNKFKLNRKNLVDITCKMAGFTLIELLVVGSAVTVLIGLLIPAVQHVRQG